MKVENDSIGIRECYEMTPEFNVAEENHTNISTTVSIQLQITSQANYF
jgi:hypothetical protein